MPSAPPIPVQCAQDMPCGLWRSGKPGSILQGQFCCREKAMASSFSWDVAEKLTLPNPTAMHQGLGQMGRDGRTPLATSFSQEENTAGLFFIRGLPRWLSGEESACQWRRCGFEPWGGKIPWSREWHSTPVFLPGKSHGQRSLVGCSPWNHKRDTTEWLNNNNEREI